MQTPSPLDARECAHGRNRDLAESTVDHVLLDGALLAAGLDPSVIRESRPSLFSDTVVHVCSADLAKMAALIAAVDEVVALPAFQRRVLERSPATGRHPGAARGVFFGFDFHLTPLGPRLIEINTNAGGGLLMAALLRGQSDPAMRARAATIEAEFLAMFREEWRLCRGGQTLKTIVIVDEAPTEQYLAPEFDLFAKLFNGAGIRALIAGPAELEWKGGVLWCRGEPVDLIYNRLTDFALEQPQCAALRAAWLADGVVLTPNPRGHALYADKRNLGLLCDPVALADLGVRDAVREVLLECVPKTVEVGKGETERFWAERKQWFFKPAAGYGSRAAYRGDKLTRRVYEEIVQGGYIAQQTVLPPERLVADADGERLLKYDLRCYAYDGRLQLPAARLYQGQTTNFRTPGGGFAPVVVGRCG